MNEWQGLLILTAILATIAVLVWIPVVLFAVWWFGGWDKYFVLWRGLIDDAQEFWFGHGDPD
jgi:hypothetical protein